MARIILIAGKGGVGKTTVAAATGLAASRQGHHTLVMSFDLAHSLSDSFDLTEMLFNPHQGQPVTINPNLDIQEIDVQEELEAHWGDIYRYGASIMAGGGLNNVVAEEVAILPGMEDIVALMCLNQHVASKVYDLIVLDCPPTSEALRFVAFSSTLDWYARKRLKLDRKLSQMARPVAKLITESADLYIPNDAYFLALQQLFEKLDGIDHLLRDPQVTSVRLVTNPDKMVVRETQRAFMYFCLYGTTIDAVVINRLLPESEGYFAEWAKSQAIHASNLKDYFNPVPVSTLPLLSNEVVGLEHLEVFAQLLYQGADPAAFFVDSPSYGFVKETDDCYRLEIRAPFVPKDQIEITRKREDLAVRVGSFKRTILLPRSVAALKTAGAAMDGDLLIIRFAKEIIS